jgi:hypothetical protein
MLNYINEIFESCWNTARVPFITSSFVWPAWTVSQDRQFSVDKTVNQIFSTSFLVIQSFECRFRNYGDDIETL